MSEDRILRGKSIDDVIETALAEINAEREGEQLGLYSRWNGLNRTVGKYFRFNHVNLFAAKMGMGKSYVLNQLHFDFTDIEDTKTEDGTIIRYALNREFKFPLELLHFGFEMDSNDEVIRQMTRLVGKSHNYLLSSQWDKTTKDYNRVTDEELKTIHNRANYLKGRPITYFETSGNCDEIYKTVKQFIAVKKKAKPGCRFIVTLDHYLLVRKYGAESDMEHIANVAALALTLRKDFGVMVIILGQMNNNILQLGRMTDPNLQYPNDGDIYMGSQLNWACDNIWIFPYRPAMINLPTYGIDKIPTDKLAVCSCVKARKGKVCDVLFQEQLETGQFKEMPDN